MGRRKGRTGRILKMRVRPDAAGGPLAAAASPSTDYESVDIRRDADGRQIVKALVIGGDEAKPGGPVSQVMREDPFERLTGTGGILAPPLNPSLLSTLWENNSDLGPCIAAMAVNCEAFGHRYIPRIEVRPDTPDAIKKQIEDEKLLLDNFFENCCIEADSFTDLRVVKRQDLEAVGYAAWEMVDTTGGEILGMNYLPAHTLRVSCLGDYVEAPRKMLVRREDGSMAYVEKTIWRRFRKFVQVRGSKMRWFREWGDPREMDAETGEYSTKPLPATRRANAVLYFSLRNAPRTPYSLPRYAGNLLSIYGGRATDEINYFTFESNNIPSMVITVSNGILSDGSISRVKSFVESQVKGQRNYSRFLVLEAEPVTEGTRDPGRVGIDIKPLTKEQRDDALFTEYQDRARSKIRRSFRLPDLIFGDTPAAGGAVGAMEILRKLVDEQVFQPERDLFDAIMNRRVLPALGVVYLRFASNTPQTTDNKDLVRVLAMAEKSGGATPRIARDILSQAFGRDLGRVTEVEPDIPFSLQVARAVQSQGDPKAALSVPGTNDLRRMGATTRGELGLDVEKDEDGDLEIPGDAHVGEALLAGLVALRQRLSAERDRRDDD